MDKKEIYEHLAKIYLDASSKRKKKSKSYPKLFQFLFFASIAFAAALAVVLFTSLNKNKSLNSEITLVIQPEAIKINFHFDPAKKEAYSINLNSLDLARYKALGFSVKKANYKDSISLRVEFTSAFKEKSAVYFRDIPRRWKDFKINLADFKNISDWSNMSILSFIVEEWNAKEKRDVVYIDNVRLVR